MWKRLRRKSMAPRRPVLFPEQAGLLLVVVLALAIGLYAVLQML